MLLLTPKQYTHTQPFYGSVEFVWDNPGEPVPEETTVSKNIECKPNTLVVAQNLTHNNVIMTVREVVTRQTSISNCNIDKKQCSVSKYV